MATVSIDESYNKDVILSSPIKKRQALHKQLQDNEAHLKTLEEQVQATQKLATLGTMAALAAHEFNNILMPMINYAELALKHPDDSDLMKKALEKTIKHGNRAALVIQSMLGLVRDQDKKCQGVRLKEAIDDCFQCLARDFSKDGISVSLQIPLDLHVQAVPGQLQQVLLNLIINARQAMLGRGGYLTLKAYTKREIAHQGLGPEMAYLEIIDTGCGIELELMEHIFKPFFTTKTKVEPAEQQGTGLGLTICKDIIEAHGGSITVESIPQQGTTFTLILPAGKSA